VDSQGLELVIVGGTGTVGVNIIKISGLEGGREGGREGGKTHTHTQTREGGREGGHLRG